MNDILFKTLFGPKLKENYTLEQAIFLLQEKNLIAIGELAEQAISVKSGVDQCDKNCPEIDLVSGKQIKHAQTNPENNKNSCLKAWVSIKGTTAPILAVVTERYTGKQYFFYFPYFSYKKHNGNAFSIPFDLSGRPNKNNKWWDYEVENFEKLCELAG
jgi:hypothetical protein